MSTIYDTEAKNLTIGELSNAIDTINIIAKDPGVAKAFRKVIKTQFNPELIQLIRDIHADSETFCDEMREMLAPAEEKEWDDNVKRYGY
jgi:site-specific DNA-adenine methylase